MKFLSRLMGTVAGSVLAMAGGKLPASAHPVVSEAQVASTPRPAGHVATENAAWEHALATGQLESLAKFALTHADSEHAKDALKHLSEKGSATNHVDKKQSAKPAATAARQSAHEFSGAAKPPQLMQMV